MKTKILIISMMSMGISSGISGQNVENPVKAGVENLQQQFTDAPELPDTAKKVSYWKHSGITGINFAQTTLVNWVAGGENAITSNLYFNGELNYAKGRWAWDNILALQYGMVYSDEYDWRKNADKIALTSKLGYKINHAWYYSLMFDYNTQFAKGYNYPNDVNWISNFMAPAYSNLALGLDYKPNEHFSVFFSPASMRATFVLDDSLSRNVPGGSFGVPEGDKMKLEAGALLKASMNKDIMKNVNAISTLDAFTPYTNNFGNIDVNWDLMLSFKINELLTATLNTTLRYYDNEHYIDPESQDKGPKIQFKEIFGLGIAYKF